MRHSDAIDVGTGAEEVRPRMTSMVMGVVMMALASASFTACGSSDSVGPAAEDRRPASTETASPCVTVGFGESASPYVGLTEAEAVARAAVDGSQIRVVGRDGQCLDVTDDLRDDRVNVELRSGRVVAAGRY